MRRVETGEVYSDEIPLDYFKEDRFKDKGYLEASVEITIKGIEKLNISKSEPILVCSGYIFSSIRKYLRSRGNEVTNKKITGITQEFAEMEFKKSLIKLGIGSLREVETMRSFYGYLEWIKKDLPSREKYVKTGWSSWKKWKKKIDG